MKKLVFAVVLLGVGGAVAWIAAPEILVRPADADAPPDLVTASVERMRIGATVLATGVVRPQVGAEVAVGSRVSGVLRDLHVTVGDRVQRGDMLAVLDPTEFEARLAQTAAALETAEIERDFAEQEYERAEALLSGEVISQMEFDDADRRLRTAAARVREAEAAYRTAQIQLDYTQIRAPISGVVATVTTQVGETVAASFAAPTFVTIVDLNRLEVWAYVDETDIGRVEVGQSATFTVDTYMGTEFDGTVTAIQPQAEIQNNVVNYITVLEIVPAPGYTLRPEMTTTVNIALESRDPVLGVSNSAIRRDDAGTFVLVPGEDGGVRRSIRTGVRGRTHTEVLSGLEEGESVILDVTR